MNTETKMIFSSTAVRLAYAFHDVTMMIRTKSLFHAPAGKSAQQVLDEYLKACSAAGAVMHNDVWLESAKKDVAEIDAKANQAFRDFISAGRAAAA